MPSCVIHVKNGHRKKSKGETPNVNSRKPLGGGFMSDFIFFYE